MLQCLFMQPGCMAGQMDQPIYQGSHDSNEKRETHNERNDAIAEADKIQHGD